MLKRIALSFFLAISFIGVSFAADEQPQSNTQFLEDRLNHIDKRYGSFLEAINLLNERHAKVLVETGTSRGGASNFVGDGGSTIIFSHWASLNDAHLISVDIDSGALANARQASIPYADYIDFVCSDSIKYLSEFGQQIDFLYLDSYDFNAWNPAPSQLHHLAEIEAAYDKLHQDSIVMIDDCDLPFGGKGKLVIDFLLERDWKIVYQGYQVILVQN